MISVKCQKVCLTQCKDEKSVVMERTEKQGMYIACIVYSIVWRAADDSNMIDFEVDR